MKKVLSLVLAVVMVLGMTTVAFAAAGDQDAEKYAVSLYSPKQLGISGSGTGVPAQAFRNADSGLGTQGDVDLYLPDTKNPPASNSDDHTDIEIYLYYWDGGQYVPITKGMNLKLDTTLKKSSGSSAMDSASIKYLSNANGGYAYIRLRLADYLVSTKDVDFKATMTLSSDGKRVKTGSTWNIVVEGTYENNTQEVEADDDKLWIEDGNVLDGQEYNKNLEIVMNDDVSLIARIFAGKKYYAAIEEEPDDAAITLMNANSSIVNYVEFKTVGLSTADVKFGYSDNMYAYTVDDDGNLVYVGRTNSTLPYYSRYFVSTRELDVTTTGDVDEPEPEPDDGTDGGTQTADGGGDDIAPSPENNYNPGTGRK